MARLVDVVELATGLLVVLVLAVVFVAVVVSSRDSGASPVPASSPVTSYASTRVCGDAPCGSR